MTFEEFLETKVNDTNVGADARQKLRIALEKLWLNGGPDGLAMLNTLMASGNDLVFESSDHWSAFPDPNNQSVVIKVSEPFLLLETGYFFNSQGVWVKEEVWRSLAHELSHVTLNTFDPHDNFPGINSVERAREWLEASNLVADSDHLGGAEFIANSVANYLTSPNPNDPASNQTSVSYFLSAARGENTNVGYFAYDISYSFGSPIDNGVWQQSVFGPGSTEAIEIDRRAYQVKQNDLLIGGVGNDIIWAGAGNDFVYGDAGDDRLRGGAGNDFIDGGLFTATTANNDFDQVIYDERNDVADRPIIVDFGYDVAEEMRAALGLAHHTFVEDATSEDHVVWGSFHLTGGVKQWPKSATRIRACGATTPNAPLGKYGRTADLAVFQ